MKMFYRMLDNGNNTSIYALNKLLLRRFAMQTVLYCTQAKKTKNVLDICNPSEAGVK